MDRVVFVSNIFFLPGFTTAEVERNKANKPCSIVVECCGLIHQSTYPQKNHKNTFFLADLRPAHASCGLTCATRLVAWCL